MQNMDRQDQDRSSLLRKTKERVRRHEAEKHEKELDEVVKHLVSKHAKELALQEQDHEKETNSLWEEIDYLKDELRQAEIVRQKGLSLEIILQAEREKSESLKGYLSLLRNERTALENDISEKKQGNLRLSKEVRELEGALQKEKSQINHLKSRVKNLENKLADSSASLKVQKEKTDSLQAYVGTLIQDQDSHSTQTEILTQIEHDTQTEMNDLPLQVTSVPEQVCQKSLIDKIEHLQAVIKQQNVQLTDTHYQLQQHSFLLAQRDTELRRLQTPSRVADSSFRQSRWITDMHQQMTQLQHTLGFFRKEAHQLQEQNKSLKTELAQSERRQYSQVLKYKSQIYQLKEHHNSELSHLEAVNRNLLKTTKEEDIRISELEKRLEELNSQVHVTAEDTPHLVQSTNPVPSDQLEGHESLLDDNTLQLEDSGLCSGFESGPGGTMRTAAETKPLLTTRSTCPCK